MSVLRRPPRELRPILIALLCLVFTCTLYAQSEVMPVSTSESVVSSSNEVSNTEPTAVSDDSNRAISVEVSPADEVLTKENESPSVVLPEVIPPSNAEAETATEKVANKIESEVVTPAENIIKETKEKVEGAVDTANNTISEAVKDVTPALKAPETPAEIIPTTTEKEPVVESVNAAQTTEKALSQGAEAAPSLSADKELDSADKESDSANNINSQENNLPEKGQKKVKGTHLFETSRLPTLVVILLLLGFVSYYTFQAQRGKEMFIRRISGLSAIEDAVGRATEMGRGVLYVPGIMDMDDIQTIAGVTIMGHVARKTAEYDTDLYAPMTRSFVMSVAQEVVKQAYMEKGRVDAYRPDRINYLTDDQFGYVAGVGGIMLRDKPAACFYLGTFYAESLILAETGNSIGAIQIAGTAEPSQIPFFVAACDYTLIGEELFAASAYLSKNPREVGSLKGQDMVKIVIIAAIVFGTILVTLARTEIGQKIGFGTAATTFMEYLK